MPGSAPPVRRTGPAVGAGRRNGNWFSIDNAFLRDGWGALVGPYAIAVYVALALHADADTGVCWPSYQTLADLTGMSRYQAMRCVRLLATVGRATASFASRAVANAAPTWSLSCPPASGLCSPRRPTRWSTRLEIEFRLG